MVRKNRKITRHLTVVALAMTYPAAARSACHQSPRIHSCSLPKKVAMMEKVNKYAVKLLLCRSLFGALLFGSLSSAAFRVTDKKFRLILNWPLTHDIDTIELRSLCTNSSVGSKSNTPFYGSKVNSSCPVGGKLVDKVIFGSENKLRTFLHTV